MSALASELVTREGPGILNWLLEGVAEYRRVGLGEPPPGWESRQWII